MRQFMQSKPLSITMLKRYRFDKATIKHTVSLLSGLLLMMGITVSAKTAVLTQLEGPSDGQPVSGIGIIRGWAFSDLAGVQIDQVTLSIDGKEITAIPCCSTRKDVLNAFPQFPEANTGNSGYGLTFNYGNLSPGTHTLTVAIQDSSGAQVSRTHTFTVIKPGNSAFIDQISLDNATATREGQDIVISNLQIRDKSSQQVQSVTSRLRWFQNTQALEMVAAEATAAVGSGRFLAHSRRAQPQAGVTNTQAASLESPLDGDTVSGIAIIRGWAIAPAGHTIERVQLFIDGEALDTIPCCSRRGDVAASFPDQPNAGNSGFGVTFNYGDLSAGVHTLKVDIEDSAGTLSTFTRGIIVRQPGDYFFLDTLDFSNATTRVSGGQLIIDNAVAQDRATGETAVRSLRYQWHEPNQAFVLAEESIAEVTVTSTTCDVNGDTRSLDDLKENPGADGVSLSEVIMAANNLLGAGRIYADFRAPGVIQCDTALPPIQGALALNGDINGDQIADVTLDGLLGSAASADVSASSGQITAESTSAGLEIRGDDVTLRSLKLLNFTGAALRVMAQAGPVSNVALLDMDAVLSEGVQGIELIAQAQAGRRAGVRRVLLSGNHLEGGDGVHISPQGETGGDTGSIIRDITITRNTIENPVNGLAIDGNASGATLSGISVINNSVEAASTESFLLRGALKNVIEVVVAGNTFANSQSEGVRVIGGLGSQAQNTMMVDIRDNLISTVAKKDGILLIGGQDTAAGNILEANVTGNVAVDAGKGIYVLGGSDNAPGNTILADIRQNRLVDNAVGIHLEGAVGATTGQAARDNTVDAEIMGNTITNAPAGILLSGGFQGAVDNRVMAITQNNDIQDSTAAGINIIGGWSARANIVNGLFADNQIRRSGIGIFVCAGTSVERDDNQGATTENRAIINILRNVVQDSADNGIVVVGGFDDSRGAVLSNVVESVISDNQTDGLVCEDNIAGNTANCMINGNTDTATAPNLYQQNRKRYLSVDQQNQLVVRIQSLRNRAARLEDPRLQQRLQHLIERLESLLDR